jgi:hypothetical protein
MTTFDLHYTTTRGGGALKKYETGQNKIEFLKSVIVLGIYTAECAQGVSCVLSIIVLS